MTKIGDPGKSAPSVDPTGRNRRRVLTAGLGIAALGCKPGVDGSVLLERITGRVQQEVIGGFVGPDHQRGHLIRTATSTIQSSQSSHSSQAQPRRVRVAILGAGIAGLSAARALQAAGIDDYQVFELDSKAGGNSRHGELAGFQCPWGAHYLPTPNLNSTSPDDLALMAMLREFGLIQKTASGEQYDERALCHAPQERVLVDGRWQSGLLPIDDAAPAALAQYERFAELIRLQQISKQFSLPARLPGDSGSDDQRVLDRISFAQWLAEHKLDNVGLRWYLDYCCRDDYGADCTAVSAWAGIHYFASRHGFVSPVGPTPAASAAPASIVPASVSTADMATEVLTWPQGNSWLVQRLAASLGERLRLNAMVRSVQFQPNLPTAGGGNASVARRGPVKLDVWLPLENRAEQWLADFVVLAIPLNVAARILQPIPAALQAVLPKLQYSAWQVANVHLHQMPPELPGAPLSWDNVIYGREWLGFVDASHQMLQSHQRETVWTSYRALGAGIDARRAVLTQTWREQSQQVLGDLRIAYPNIERYVRAIDVVRWGHAMIVPSPGLRSMPAFQAIRHFDTRVHFAHSDLAGYSIFEEAFAAGLAVAGRIAEQLKG